MKTFALALTAALISIPAFAHPSVVPHQHPHGASALPDAALMFAAAVLVGFGLVALRRIGKE